MWPVRLPNFEKGWNIDVIKQPFGVQQSGRVTIE